MIARTWGGPGLRMLALLLLVGLATGSLLISRPRPPRTISAAPPPAGGFFRTLPPGAWRTLPGDTRCAQRVHRSSWEPRPDNTVPNHRMPPLNEVRESLGHIKRSTEAGYDGSWDTWLLPRVTGHHTGTTDENIQWAACKWGISDDLIRAIALRESGWYQYEVYPNGRCVLKSGCGDVFPSPGPATRRYCAMVASYGPDYQTYLGRGHCPKTFSIVGVMSWQDPTWGPMPGNQNGTFPFNRDSTAFALDYLGSFLRGCQEGWVLWLGHGGSGYGPGRLWGCVGVWYAGAWDSPEARHYVSLVKAAMSQHPWLAPDWADERLPCSAHHGCPRGVT